MAENKKSFNYDSNLAIYLRILKEAFLPNTLKFLFAMAFMMIASSTIAYRAYLIKPAIDKVFVSKDQVALFFIPIQLILVALGSSIATIVHQLLMQRTVTNISIKYQKSLFENLINTDVDFYSNKGSYKIMDLFNDVNGLLSALNLVFTGFIKEFFSIFGLLALMFFQSPKLAVISMIGFPLVIIPFRMLSKRLKKIAKTGMELGGTTNQTIGEAFSLIELIKSSAMESREVRKFNRIALRNFKNSMQMAALNLVNSPMMEMAGTLGFAGVLWVGGKQVIEGTMTSGTFFTFITAALSVYKPAKSFGNIGQNLQRTLLSARRLFITLDAVPLVRDSKNAVELENVKGDIELKNVYFKYQIHEKNEALIEENRKIIFAEKYALNKVNIAIKRGENVALVGHSGSGKSTIFKLLQRFYDVSEGSLQVDGIDVRDLTLHSLRKNISVVSQDVALFNASIKENIKYGAHGVNEKDIINACEMANAMEFIDEMKDGLDTMLGPNGALLSGGQKQRVSIARAILKNAPILLLDEATSALDPISEKLIQTALAKLMKGKTTIAIAHRLSTVQNCDKIFVMKQGEVIEVGNHDELMEKGGHYSILYKKQFEKIKVDDE
ncbi:MAG: ABC transporter transmembrane domain-containing protein [Rickettsiales bacterium]|nr:MAG: ABC transporter transmembrane domain-containing protein [Rickettsiales bacterium]